MQPQSNNATRNLHNVKTEAVNPNMRPQPIDRPANARLKVIRMQPMQQQHGLDLLVLRQPRQDRRAAIRVGHDSHQLGQSDAMYKAVHK